MSQRPWQFPIAYTSYTRLVAQILRRWPEMGWGKWHAVSSLGNPQTQPSLSTLTHGSTKTVFLINLLGLFSGNCHNLSIHPIPIPPNPPQPPPRFSSTPNPSRKAEPGATSINASRKKATFTLVTSESKCLKAKAFDGMEKSGTPWHPPYDMGNWKKHPAFCPALPKKTKKHSSGFFWQLLIAFWEIFRDLLIFLADIIATKPPNNPSQPPSQQPTKQPAPRSLASTPWDCPTKPPSQCRLGQAGSFILMVKPLLPPGSSNIALEKWTRIEDVYIYYYSKDRDIPLSIAMLVYQRVVSAPSDHTF